MNLITGVKSNILVKCKWRIKLMSHAKVLPSGKYRGYHCMSLANLYSISLDELVSSVDKEPLGIDTTTCGTHIFGYVKVGEHGQIVIPKEALSNFDSVVSCHYFSQSDR